MSCDLLARTKSITDTGAVSVTTMTAQALPPAPNHGMMILSDWETCAVRGPDQALNGLSFLRLFIARTSRFAALVRASSMSGGIQ